MLQKVLILRYVVSHEGRNMHDGCPWGWSIIDDGWEAGPIVDCWGLTKKEAVRLAREMNEEEWSRPQSERENGRKPTSRVSL